MNKKILWQLSYGLYALMADNDGKPTGCIVNTVFQITSENPIVAVSVNKDNFTNEVIKKSRKFGVSILSETTSPDTISALGFFSGKDKDKLSDIKYHLTEDNIPVIEDNCSGHMFCEVVNIVETQTHDVFFGRVIQTEDGINQSPMTYKYYHEVVKGKAPKNAPTFRQEETRLSGETYVCTVCGHIYKGDINKESDDFVCPVCKVSKEKFIKN